MACPFNARIVGTIAPYTQRILHGCSSLDIIVLFDRCVNLCTHGYCGSRIQNDLDAGIAGNLNYLFLGVKVDFMLQEHDSCILDQGAAPFHLVHGDVGAGCRFLCRQYSHCPCYNRWSRDSEAWISSVSGNPEPSGHEYLCPGNRRRWLPVIRQFLACIPGSPEEGSWNSEKLVKPITASLS